MSLLNYYQHKVHNCIIQMHNYKGQLRRDYQDHTPTKSSWERQKELHPPSKHQSRVESKYETKQDEKYQPKYQPRHQSKFQKSQLSYYQSQASRVVYDYDRSERPSARSHPYASEDKSVFNEIMAVRTKSFEREEYEQGLRVQIQNKMEKGFSTLTILLTDDLKPTFLWHFSIREADFMTLKNQQKLKVSYSGFPQMLQNCFRECQIDHGEKNNQLLLEIKKGGEGTLYVLESNRYKESVHLFLHFKQANDQQVKEYLAQKLIVSQEEVKDSRKEIVLLQHTLDQRCHEVNKMSAQLNQIQREEEQRFQQMKIDYERQINQTKQKSLTEVSKMKRESENETKQMKHKLSSQIQTLSRSKQDLTKRLMEARQKIAHFQSNERQQNIKITRLQQDVSKYLKQYDSLKSQNKQLSDKRFQNQKNITELTCKLESLKSEIEDKKTIISSTVQNKDTISSQISTLEGQNNQHRKQIVKLETKITQLEGQISKLASSNAQLTDKVGRQKQKLKERVDVIKEQEKEVRELKKTETTLERQNDDLKFKNGDKETKIKGLQEQMQLLQKKLQDETSMVVHLQKQMNERSVRSTPFYSNTSYQPTPPYSGVNRELPSQLSANSNVSTSRVTTNLRQDKMYDKYEPNIKRYEQRSKSPLPKRLTQQRQPQQEENLSSKAPSFDQPRPVKFKMSQPRQYEK